MLKKKKKKTDILFINKQNCIYCISFILQSMLNIERTKEFI